MSSVSGNERLLFNFDMEEREEKKRKRVQTSRGTLKTSTNLNNCSVSHAAVLVKDNNL